MRRFPLLAALACAACFAATPCLQSVSRAQPPEVAAPAPAGADLVEPATPPSVEPQAPVHDAPHPLRYQVAFSGLADKALEPLLRSVSDTVAKAGKPVADLFLLRGRARGDLKKFQDALASRGYFSAKARFAIDDSATPARVLFTVEPGDVYLLKWVDVELAEDSDPVRFPFPEAPELGLATDAPAISKDIVDAGDKLVAVFKNRGHPFATLARRKAVADPRAHTLHVTYVVKPGPYAVFGPLTVTGLKDVRESLLLPLVPWKQGDEYRQDQVDGLQRRLADLGLFARATVAPKAIPGEPGRVEMDAQVVERKPRTFKGGLTYTTDDGPGAQINWEHRDLFGKGERLRLHAAVSPVSKVVEVNFENPFFLDRDQRLLAGFKAADEDTKAYHGQNATGEVKVSRKLTEHLSAQAGAGYRASLVYDDAANPTAGTTRYGLASLPLGLSADTRDDPLNPAKGWTFAVNATPWLDTQGTNRNFVKATVSGSRYLRVLETPTVIVATRAGLGSLSGVSASRLIPPDVRFYAGGSGSIRGYAYQTAGPLRGDKPLGGRSLFDFGTELRIRLTEMFGVVFFLDGGNAYETEYPEPGKGLLLGAGTGLRVYTPIGPFRVDVATPLWKRPNVDDAVQFYISLGQAF